MLQKRRFWLAIVVILAIMIPTVIAISAMAGEPEQAPKGHNIQANEEQLNIIGELWGTDITVGEVLEQVFPEVLADMPEYILERVYAIKIHWPDPEEDYPSSSFGWGWYPPSVGEQAPSQTTP